MKRVLQVCAFLLILSRAGSGATLTSLTGRYVLVQRTTVVADIPILPDLSTETRSVSLLNLVADADRLEGRGTLCSVDMHSSSNLVRTELSRGLQRLLSTVQFSARLVPRTGGFLLEETPRVLVLGARLRDPEHEPLPKQASDPRVIDQDGDGKPGVTVLVRGIVTGEVYVVQRGATALNGTSDPQGFHGAVRFRTEDAVLGASRSALMRRTATRPDFSRSTFVLRKVGSDVDCTRAQALARDWR